MLWAITNQKENKWIHNHITSAHSKRLKKDLLYAADTRNLLTRQASFYDLHPEVKIKVLDQKSWSQVLIFFCVVSAQKTWKAKSSHRPSVISASHIKKIDSVWPRFMPLS